MGILKMWSNVRVSTPPPKTTVPVFVPGTNPGAAAGFFFQKPRISSADGKPRRERAFRVKLHAHRTWVDKKGGGSCTVDSGWVFVRLPKRGENKKTHPAVNADLCASQQEPIVFRPKSQARVERSPRRCPRSKFAVRRHRQADH